VGSSSRKLFFGGADDGLEGALAGQKRQRGKGLAEGLVDVRVRAVRATAGAATLWRGSQSGVMSLGAKPSRAKITTLRLPAPEGRSAGRAATRCGRHVVHHAAVAQAEEIVALQQPVEQLVHAGIVAEDVVMNDAGDAGGEAGRVDRVGLARLLDAPKTRRAVSRGIRASSETAAVRRCTLRCSARTPQREGSDPARRPSTRTPPAGGGACPPDPVTVTSSGIGRSEMRSGDPSGCRNQWPMAARR